MRVFQFAAIACLALIANQATATDKPAAKLPPPDPEHIRKMIPTRIEASYAGGELVEWRVEDRIAYVVRPTGTIDRQRRWIWIFPFWLGINDGHGRLHHRLYVERFLARGFHVAGIDVGTSCGSPTAAALCQKFYRRVLANYDLHPRARLVGQSNGGVMAYAWGFRNPECVDRIGGICPATDFRTWPTLPNVINFPDQGLGFQLSLEELTTRTAEFNPVDNLAPLAAAGVKLLHIHGD
ncbi:MAG: hypothetical protein ACKV0T_28475 [Planctomycetales bacterium]